ncbi:MAG: hypothetical protein P1P87_13510 [Trueperaceae bacterium]|nr:hypothetical protein [Trueperaceae bacterium]
MRNPGRSAWQVDVTWAAALLAWAAIVVATLAGSAARATAPDLGPALQAALLDAAFVELDAAPALVPGTPDVALTDPFEPLPGAGVLAPLADLEALDVSAVRARVARALADARMQGAGWLEGVSDATLAAELRALDAAVLRPLAEAELRRALYPLGVDDGSRAADWATQAQQNPGQPVQPIVGVFVRLPVDQVRGAGPLLVGERVVAGLTDVLLEGGRSAAEAALANAALSAALASALDGPLPAAWRSALDAALRARDAVVQERLSALRDAAADRAPAPDPAGGLPTPADLADATPEEARAATLVALAERGYEGGASALGAVLADPAARARVDRAAWAFDAASEAAHGRYRLWTGVLGVVGLLLLVIAAVAAVGVARAWVPGLAIVAAALPLWALARAVVERTAATALPGDVAGVGAVAGVAAWGSWLVATVGDVVADAVLWVPLGVAALGAALVAIAVLITVVGWVRPQRRSRF